MQVSSPLTGVVVEVHAADGASVPAGSSVLLLEAMKMHQEICAPAAGVVRGLSVSVGDQVQEGQPLFELEETEGAGERVERAAHSESAPDAIRPDLAEALERPRLTGDEARPAAVEKRRSIG